MAAVRFSNTPSAKILTALARSRPTPAAWRRPTRSASWASPASTCQRRAATPGQGPVGGQHLRAHGGVLPGGDHEPVQVGLAALDRGLPFGLAGPGGEVG